jgi:hypothetical protein
VTLDSSGAITGQAKRWWACSTPVSTMPTPYSGNWGAKTRSMRVPTSWDSGGMFGSSPTIGPASRATSTASGTSSSSVQVSSAEATASTRSRSPAATAPASSGTTRLASAPPATSSKTMLGTVFAAL